MDSKHDIPRTLRNRPLLEKYTPSEAWNAAGGIQETIRDMIGENVRLRTSLAKAEDKIKQLTNALTEMNNERQGAATGEGS